MIVSNDLEGMWKEVEAARCEICAENCKPNTEDIHEKFQKKYLVNRSEIRIGHFPNTNHKHFHLRRNTVYLRT
jgi:hypothetical protein